MKKALMFIIVATIFTGNLSAGSKYGYKNRTGNDKNAFLYYPRSPEHVDFPSQWKEDAFILKIDQDVTEHVQSSKDKFDRILRKTEGMAIDMKPIEKPFKTIDNIYLSSEYSTTIVFPQEYKINKAFTVSDLAVVTYSENTLILQAKRDFVEGSIVVSLTNKRNQNKIMTIVLRRFISGRFASNNMYNIKYANDKIFFSPMIYYRNKLKASEDVIIDAMYKMYGDRVIDSFKKDCDFETIEYGGINYFVIRDNKFGTIEYDGINFRVENEYVGCGEEVETKISQNVQDEELK